MIQTTTVHDSNNHSTQVAMNIITKDYIMTMNIIKRLCLLVTLH